MPKKGTRKYYTNAAIAVALDKAQKWDDHCLHEATKPFVAELLENCGLLLSQKPYAEWPELAKIAFRHAAERVPTGAQLYKMQLPE